MEKWREIKANLAPFELTPWPPLLKEKGKSRLLPLLFSREEGWGDEFKRATGKNLVLFGALFLFDILSPCPVMRCGSSSAQRERE